MTLTTEATTPTDDRQAKLLRRLLDLTFAAPHASEFQEKLLQAASDVAWSGSNADAVDPSGAKELLDEVISDAFHDAHDPKKWLVAYNLQWAINAAKGAE